MQCCEQQAIQGTGGDTKGEQNAQETKSTGASSHHLWSHGKKKKNELKKIKSKKEKVKWKQMLCLGRTVSRMQLSDVLPQKQPEGKSALSFPLHYQRVTPNLLHSKSTWRNLIERKRSPIFKEIKALCDKLAALEQPSWGGGFAWWGAPGAVVME